MVVLCSWCKAHAGGVGESAHLEHKQANGCRTVRCRVDALSGAARHRSVKSCHQPLRAARRLHTVVSPPLARVRAQIHCARSSSSAGGASAPRLCGVCHRATAERCARGLLRHMEQRTELRNTASAGLVELLVRHWWSCACTTLAASRHGRRRFGSAWAQRSLYEPLRPEASIGS